MKNSKPSDLQDLISNAQPALTNTIAGNIEHHSEEDFWNSPYDVLSMYECRTWPKEIRDILAGKSSFSYPESLTEVLDHTPTATKERITSNISHQQPKMNSTEILPTLDQLKNELFPKALVEKGKLLAQTRETVAKRYHEKAISNLAEAAMQILTLMVWGGQLYLYEEPIWKPQTMETLILKLRAAMQDDSVTSFLNEKDFKNLYYRLLTTPDLEVKEIEKDSEALSLIACKDGVYDTENGHIREILPTDYFFSYIDISVREIGRGSGEVFEKFVKNLSDGDPDLRKLLLEVIGVIVSGYYPKVFFLLLGPKNSGKSQFSSFCEGLVGRDFCTSVESLNSFSDRWTTGELLGKRLCIAHDTPKTVINANSMAEIKELVGRDLVKGEKKYRNPFYFVNEAKLMFASNHRLRIADASEEDAFLDRVVTIPFCNSVPRNAWIPDIGKILLQERGYIIGQAIKALRDLKRRNFVFTKVDADFYDDEPQGFDPIIAFVSQRCELDSVLEIDSEALHCQYLQFLSEFGLPEQNCAIFSRQLKKKYPQLESIRNAGGEIGKRGYKGIGLRINFQSLPVG